MTGTPPTLKEGEKVHHIIYHDETCAHPNDQSNFVWIKDGEQPLRNKSRGRIVHVSDFIIEHSGRLAHSEAEITAQMKLPKKPAPPTPVSENPPENAGSSANAPADNPVTDTGKKKKARKSKKQPNKKPTATDR